MREPFFYFKGRSQSVWYMNISLTHCPHSSNLLIPELPIYRSLNLCGLVWTAHPFAWLLFLIASSMRREEEGIPREETGALVVQVLHSPHSPVIFREHRMWRTLRTLWERIGKLH